jgi:Skp family chaperone for outer membrane proteins
MKAIAAVLALMSLQAAWADEIRVAHFDAKKVFATCQHAKDVETELQAHLGGSHKMEELQKESPELWQRYQFLMNRITELDKQHSTRSDEQQDDLFQRYAQDLRLLETQINKKKDADQAIFDRQMKDEIRQIYREIGAAAAQFGREHGYFAIIPKNKSSDESTLPSVIITAPGDDVTDAVIEMLNKDYATRKAK